MSNVFDLGATLSLDKSDYDNGLKDASNKASAFGSKFKSAMKAGAVAIGAIAAAAGVATIKIGKSALSAYADYEQLEGGIKKLYGNMGMSVEEYAKSVNKSVNEINKDWERNEKAQTLVFENAKKAFQTTGLSANQYMEQATSFSASLINSLEGDTVKAAEQTDVAMRAISDNYNTFGGDLNNIQYAFQGFAKQNYTMLDNLKLGYGGTKTEMERLIADANTWAEENGKAADLSIDSFSDVVTAIDYIQQKQGIAGTTAREASTTIAGSVGMVKAAYENLISGLANPDADISQLVNDLVSSIGTAAGNIMPAIKQLAEGFGSALSELAPSIIEGIPNMMSSVLPMIIDSTGQMMGVILETLRSTGPQLMSAGADIMLAIIDGVKSNASTFISTGLNSLVKFSNSFKNGAGKLVDLGLQLIKTLANGIIQNIPTFIQTVPVIITNFANVINENAPKVIATGVSILISLIAGIIKAIPTLVANIPNIIKAIVAVITAFSWASLGSKLIKGIANGIKHAGSSLKGAVNKPINAVKNAITNKLNAAKEGAKKAFNGIKNAAKDKINAAKDAIKKAVDKIKGFFPLKFGKIFSGLKLPHFSVSGGSFPFGVAGKGSLPSWSVSWYKKAE